MEISSARKLCQHLIGSAIRRCRLSENLCRLSILLKCDHTAVQIAISDTGVGSNWAEIQDMEHSKNYFSAEKWDGVLCITTTSICDKEIYHYRLHLKDDIATTRLTRLPTTPKKCGKFSGTEVSFTTTESRDELVAWITSFCQKILILKISNVAVELIVEFRDMPTSRCEYFLHENEGILLSPSTSYIARLASGFEDYVLKHGNVLATECQTCFSSREHLKVANGVTCTEEGIRSTRQVVEAVVAVTKVPDTSDPCCLRQCGTATEVLYFQDFSPCSMPESCLNALTNIDWQKYGLTLRNNRLDLDGHAVLEWENLPPCTCIDIILHSYCEKIQQTEQRNQVDKNLVKKAVKLAIDDLKAKYSGLFLSPHALKIRSYAPDLSRAISGLILSSNDSVFRGECASLLGLHPQDIGEQGKVESCIREKIIGVIEMNDRRPKSGRQHAPHLFQDDVTYEEEYQDEDEEFHEGEEDVDILDL